MLNEKGMDREAEHMAQGVLGLDIGTSGVKAAVFGADGAILASASSGYGSASYTHLP